MMDKRESIEFRYSIPAGPGEGARRVTQAEAERHLLERLGKATGGERIEAMMDLAQFYKVAGRPERAIEILQGLLAQISSAEERAQIVFTLGQAAENLSDYEMAARYYRQALAMEPCNGFHWYFIHNNLGFSLNQLGRFAEGEDCCRRAIAIDAGRSNAFKNLGLALAGQGRFAEAAEEFVRATQANAADGRSVKLLEALVEEHPELREAFGVKLKVCRQAVSVVELEARRRQGG
jgi:tetratricopeptide (TPR) repeat protein